MTRSRRDLGDFGERVAAAHLEANGYRIVERNFRVREGEVDIIAERDSTLVFVEVRTRRGEAMGSAAESVTATKAAHLLAVAAAYAQARDWSSDQRIDVIAVSLAPDGRVLSVEQIEGAVEEGGG
ncbi:MAG: YraN family protein [Dehalococcoidia bacterium]